VPPGTYDYALSARSAAGESTASTVTGVVVPAGTTGSTVNVSFSAVCHAESYQLYRRSATTGAWSLVGSLPSSGTAATDDGTNPVTLTIADAQAAGTAGAPPAANGATITPYPQNPNYLAGVTSAGGRVVATDASKTYPQDPNNVAGPQWGLGATFTEGTPPASFQAVPRYPSNVYYNVSRQGQQLDEYNWIYVAPASGGGCVPIPDVTTCRTTAATWAEYVASENTIMFRHLMGNDPRPHFMHQSNLADYNPALPETDPNQGGVLYPMIDGLLARYDTTIDRAKAPLVQPTSTQVAATLARQNAWAAHLAAGDVTAWLQDGSLHVKNASGGPVEVPLTGTKVGDLYAGQRSGWKTVAPGAEEVLAPDEPANATPPSVDGAARAGQRLTATAGRWTGTAPIDHGYHWQRCGSRGNACATIAGATSPTYEATAADVGARLRVVVSAGNWIASVSQARSTVTGVVAAAPVPPKKRDGAAGRDVTGRGRDGARGPKSAPALRLTAVTMRPARFAVAHRVKPRGTRLDGSRVGWRLSRRATVRLVFQRPVRVKGHRRWVTVGAIARKAGKGAGVVRFTGRFKARPLAPGRYRLTVTARAGRQKAGPRHVAFRVVRG
jgi:hypothetical protein